LPGSELTGQDRVIEICKIFDADHYINPIGGVDLYENALFNQQGIKLSFLQTSDKIKYHQWNDTFTPNLSIIDILMFNSKSEVLSLLEAYSLVGS
jgi:hypothetical protein